jgi:hypothetical protein
MTGQSPPLCVDGRCGEILRAMAAQQSEWPDRALAQLAYAFPIACGELDLDQAQQARSSAALGKACDTLTAALADAGQDKTDDRQQKDKNFLVDRPRLGAKHGPPPFCTDARCAAILKAVTEQKTSWVARSGAQLADAFRAGFTEFDLTEVQRSRVQVAVQAACDAVIATGRASEQGQP